MANAIQRLLRRPDTMHMILFHEPAALDDCWRLSRAGQDGAVHGKSPRPTLPCSALPCPVLSPALPSPPRVPTGCILLYTAAHRLTLLYIAPHCTTSLHIALHRSTLLYIAPRCSTSLHFALHRSTSHYIAPHCTTSLHIALHRSTSLYIAPHCTHRSTLHYIAPHCSTSLHIAVPCPTLP